ncbi:MAG: tetratricopeptide repeat protein [Bacteroidales bacterium]|nr:tetratricopeptide repeat protein [Bacteroidales bacterium]
MNRTRIILLTLILVVTTTACHHRIDLSQLPPDEALQQLDIQIRHNPKDPELLYARAKIYVDERQANNAINDLGRAISLNGKEAKYYALMADAQLMNGNIEQSYQNLNRANELTPNNTSILLKMGEVALYSNDYDRAIDHLSKVTAEEPDNITALFMKSIVYTEKGDTVNAVGLLRRICDLNPEFGPAFEHLGVLYANRLNPLAVEYLNTAITLDPTNTHALYALAMYYQDREEMSQAEEIYKRILDIDDRNYDAWHNRGYIAMMYYNDYELAIEYFDHALTIAPNYTLALFHRGLAHELMGERSLARNDYQAALDIDPNYQPATDQLKKLK